MRIPSQLLDPFTDCFVRLSGTINVVGSYLKEEVPPQIIEDPVCGSE